MRRKKSYTIDTPWLAFMDSVITVIPIMVIMTVIFIFMKGHFDSMSNQLKHYFLLDEKNYDSKYILMLSKQEDGVYLIKNLTGILFEESIIELKNEIENIKANEIHLELLFSIDNGIHFSIDELFNKYISIKSSLNRTLTGKKITYNFRKTNMQTPPMIIIKGRESP